MKWGPPAAVRRLLLTPILVGVAVAGLASGAAPAQADEPEALVSVSIDAMTPALPTSAGTVRLSGTVTNTSNRELTNLQVAFWRSLDPIQDADGMEAALDSAADEPLGARVSPGTLFQNIPSDDDRTLGPDQSTPFAITAKVSDLKLTAGDAVYLIGIHVRGRDDPDGPDSTLGRGRIFMPLTSSAPKNPLRMTTLVVISSRPSWVRSGVLADDHLATELAADGRLRTLLTAAGRAETSFAVDPALVQEVETMSQGYQVSSEDGVSQPGRGQSAAEAWLDDLDDLIEDGDGFRLLYGSPDIAAVVHSGRADLLQNAVEAGQTVSTTRDLPLLVLPGRGRADQAVVEAAERLEPKAIVLSDLTAKGPGPLLTGPTTEAGPGAPIVSYSAEALGGGPGPAPRGTSAKVRQRMLADTWLEASTSKAGSTVGRVRLVTSASQATAAGPDGSVPWLRPSTLSSLLGGTPSDWSQKYRFTAPARNAQLSDGQLSAVDRLREDYTTYTDLMIDKAVPAAEGRAVAARAVSTAWRGNGLEQDSYLLPITGRVRRILTEGVVLTANPRVLTTGRDATFPITVRNALPADPDAEGTDRNAVGLSITFDSNSPQRLTMATLPVPGGVNGQASTTENAGVQARTNGTVRVVAQLVTRSGRPVGRPLPIEVNATQAGTTGWIIAIAAGVVLLGSTALRIRQVARERAASTPPVPLSRPPEDAETGPDRETLDV